MKCCQTAQRPLRGVRVILDPQYPLPHLSTHLTVYLRGCCGHHSSIPPYLDFAPSSLNIALGSHLHPRYSRTKATACLPTRHTSLPFRARLPHQGFMKCKMAILLLLYNRHPPSQHRHYLLLNERSSVGPPFGNSALNCTLLPRRLHCLILIWGVQPLLPLTELCVLEPILGGPLCLIFDSN